jgi:hypothetical protein
MTATPIYLEVGQKKVFACAIDWPGWSRSGKTDEAAIEALAEYATRYRPVASAAGLSWPKSVADDFRVVERTPGNATTDFGAPGVIADVDQAPMTAAARKRIAKLVGAAWTVFDDVVAKTPPELRKGPRGGGRNRDKMIDHVLGAEVAYARKFGVKHKQPAIDDRAAIDAVHADILAALEHGDADAAWPAPYVARRIAWHVLDHAWEMEDKRDL